MPRYRFKNLEGCIGLSRTDSWISRVIRWFTKSKWSHCFVVWRVIGNSFLEILVVEAGEFTVQIVPFEKYVSGHFVFELYDVGDIVDCDKIGDAFNRLLRKVETHYGWLQLIGFGIVILLRKWFGWKSKKNIWGRGKICSEVVAEYLIDCGVDKKSLCGDKDINLISPEDIYRFLAVRNCKCVLKKDDTDEILVFA